MNKKEESVRKNKLLTARLSDEDIELLSELSERTNRTKSDTIIRACKFWLNARRGADDNEDESEIWGKVSKNNRVHLRVRDADMAMLNDGCNRLGLPISQVIRRSIREYFRSLKDCF